MAILWFSDMLPFQVGDQVVCVDAKIRAEGVPLQYRMYIDNNEFYLSGLTEGKTYTIRWIGEYTGLNGGTAICVRLVEIIRNYDILGNEEMPYFADRFRPLEKTKTDISKFTKMLGPKTKKRVLEDA